ncbi:MAG: polyprenyl synthetase family protein [Bacteroidia bacterium]|nr:polyprenyl synthetase family protein [Bacteroidia bacterium]
MALNLEDIKRPIRGEMEEFELKFRKAMQSTVPLLDRIMHYIVKRKGKQMRPMFVFLAAGVNGSITESTYRAASLIELLHTATLVHDDVVDDSNLRRGFFSINAIWKNKIAVLVGDYLLSRGLLLSVEHEEFELLKIVSTAVRKMSEGELLQIEKARKLDINESVYYDIIKAKTASLIASCCATGASSTGAMAEQVKQMHDFGEAVGIAFQIKDDLFDFEQAEQTGKPRGIDIKEHKMTLPLIHALGRVSSSEKKFIINTVKSYSEDKPRVERVIRLVIEAGGLNYAREKMHHFQDQAFKILSAFPSSAYRDSLEKLVRFTTERNH